MRSRSEIAAEIGEIAPLIAEFGDDVPFGAQLMRDSLIRRREQLQLELAGAPRGLRVVLDGPKVLDHVVEVHTLVNVLGPLERALGAIGQALENVRTNRGRIPEKILSQVRLGMQASFAGSFGVALVGPPPKPDVDEPTLFPEEKPDPLFQRAVERLIDVLEAGANEDDYQGHLLEEVADLGQRAISLLTEFSENVAISAGTVDVAWASDAEPERFVRFTPGAAANVQQVLSRIEVSESTGVAEGRLVEASLVRRTFGIQLEDDTVLRGRVNADIAHRVQEYFGRDVAAQIRTSTTESKISGEQKVRYTLDNFVADLDPDGYDDEGT